MQALAEAHRVILPELPGFGFRLPLGGEGALPPGGGPRHPPRVMERLDIGRAGLVGHSLGAPACAGLAGADAGQVLTLVALPVRTAGAGLLGNALPAVRTILGLPLAAASRWPPTSPRARRWLHAAGELLVTEHAQELAGSSSPRCSCGARDVLVPLRRPPSWRGDASLPLRVIPGAGRPMLDRPDDLTRELRDFGGWPGRGPRAVEDGHDRRDHDRRRDEEGDAGGVADLAVGPCRARG